MKIGKDTQQRINEIKLEAVQAQRTLENCLIRLQEHPGTKRLSKPLQSAVLKVSEFAKG